MRGSATLDGAGEATITVSNLAPGAHSLTASYPGDSANGASTSTGVAHTVATAATTTALTVSPPGSSVHGNPVTLTATVSAPDSAAIPAGSVEFFDGSTSIGSESVDPSGVAAMVTSSLAAGTYALRADFTPATGFVASSSPITGYTVSPATTATGLTASSASSVFGQSVTLVATVTGTNSPNTPVGAVTFRDGTAVLGVVALDGAGSASLATTDIAVGSRTLTAEYPDATSFAGSTSAGLAHTVNRAAVSVQVTDTPDPSVAGTGVTLDVTVSPVAPGAGVPTGTATVREGAAVRGTVTLDGTGAGTTTVTGLTVGPHTLVVEYAGDGRFAVGSGSTTHTVVADTTTVDLASSAPTAQFTQPVTFTADVNGTGPGTPTGTVTFRNGATVLGADALDGAGQALLTVSNLPFGTHTITADYPGDAGFGPATDSITQKVNTTGTASTLTVTPPAPTVYDVETLTATVAGTASAVVPAGTVTFYDNGVPLGTAATNGSGKATYSTTFNRVVHTLTATFSGTPGWAGSTSAPVNLTPDRAPTFIVLSGTPSPVGVGDTTTWTATLNLSPSGPAPTGSVQFWSGSTFLGAASIAGGTATLSLPAPPAVGTWAVFATYNGDADHEPGSSPTASVSVTGAVTSITAAVPPTTNAGDPFVLGAQVASAHSGAPITGAVRFTSSSPAFAPRTAPVDGTGFAQITAAGIPAGSWTVTAGFEPSSGSRFAASSTTETLVIVRRSAAVSLTAPASATVGANFPVSFAITDLTSTGPTPVGTVVVSGGGISCSGTVTAGSCNLALVTPGPVTLTAAYSGDAAYLPATSNPAVVTGLGNTSTLTASTPTQTWVTGDPIVIAWNLIGPPTGEVVVRTPFGEVCRSTVLRFGSCTITLPFEQRGQSIPVDVAYLGSPTWSPGSATVVGTLVGCFPVVLSAVPAFAGVVTAPAGNCNAATGYRSGTTVNASVTPVAPYALDHWLEDGGTFRIRSFVVSEDDHSATAILNAPCVAVRFGAAEQVDIGPLRSSRGLIGVSPPNCPGRATVDSLGSGGTATAWYLPGTDVTLTPTPNRPATDELKGWFVDGVLRRTRGPLTLKIVEDTAIEGRFGVRCGRPKFTTVGEGSVDPFTTPNCLDAEGFAWQLGTELGAHVVPGPHHWIASYGDDAPRREITSPQQWLDAKVVGTQANAFWTMTTGLDVGVVFETCSLLALTPGGPGRIDPVTAPSCRTRLPSEGLYYEPGSRVELQAVPNPPSTRITQEGGENVTNEVVPAFLRWSSLEIEALRDLADPNAVTDQGQYRDEDGRYDPSTGGLDATRALVDMADDRTIGAEFYDQGRCMPFITEVKPEGAATLDVTLDVAEGSCPDGEADLGEPRIATFRATPVSANPLVGWTVTTTDVDTEETVEFLMGNTGRPLEIKNGTTATAYVCSVIVPEITLIAPDGSEVTGPPPADSDFVQADTESDCPVWQNAFQVGQQIKLSAAAPAAGYEFVRWEGDVRGEWYEQAVDIDGSRPTILARAVYRVRCVTVTLQPSDHLPVYSPPPNCPHAEGAASTGFANELRYIGGTPVMLDARAVDDYDFASWTGEGLLDREQMVEAFRGVGLEDLVALAQVLDHPAMITADFDMTVTANYTHHPLSQRIADDLAVAGKKTVGVLSIMMIGAYESLASGLLRVGLLAVQFLTEAISSGPVATDTVMVLKRMQAMLDLPEITLICAAEWAKGEKAGVVDIGAFDNNRVDAGDLAGEVASAAKTEIKQLFPDEIDALKKRAATEVKKVATAAKVKVGAAISNFRRTSMGAVGAQYDQKVPTSVATASRSSGTFSKVAQGLGVAATIGSAIYEFVASGPGVVWEDTAEQAWETGRKTFEDCVVREIQEAFPEEIPVPAAP